MSVLLPREDFLPARPGYSVLKMMEMLKAMEMLVVRATEMETVEMEMLKVMKMMEMMKVVEMEVMVKLKYKREGNDSRWKERRGIGEKSRGWLAGNRRNTVLTAPGRPEGFFADFVRARPGL